MPTVNHRGKKRKARGYTAAEIVEAGLTVQDLAKHKLRMDPNRRTTYAENVKELKKLK